MAWLRGAGRGSLPDGASVLWSVAEGSRGRRWRWTVADGGVLRHTGLLETTADGRFARLELDGAGTMLTLHPEPDLRTAHGNVVSADGVQPIDIGWHPDCGIEIAGDPFGSALCPGTERRAQIEAGGDVRIVEAIGVPPPGLDRDLRGVPQLADAREWPLEV